MASPCFLHDQLQTPLTTSTEVEDVGWDMGTPLAEVKRLTEVWKNGFDWRKAEAKLNVLPHYTTDIDVEGFGTLNIHFLHSKSAIKNAIPLLFVHGWPGGFWEANKILPLLTTGRDGSVPSFDVVVPSLPGYGFSDGCKTRGFGLLQVKNAHSLRLKPAQDARSMPKYSTSSCSN